MPFDTSPSTSPTKRMNAVITSQAEVTIPATYRSRNGSPPRTPQRRRKDPPSSYPKSARLAAATGTTFFDGYDRDSPVDDDGEDPHDLTYSSQHFPRASMVDNMLMALDQFSHPTTDSTHYDEDLRGGYRGRGHTFSSSVSSESDVRALQAKPVPIQVQRLTRRSSARYARDPAKLPSIFGEDEDSARIRLYESQRAAQPTRSKKQRSVDEKNSDGNTTNADVLPHLKQSQGKLGPAGNRRSQSFDFGPRRQLEEDDSTDIVPHPVVYSGPEAQKASSSPSRQPPTIGRRGSTKSTKNTRSKSSMIGTSAVHAMTAPPVPSTNAATPSGPKTPLFQIAEQTPAPHQGFFKRFFGSSRNLATHSAPPATPIGRRSLENVKDAINTTTMSRLQRPSHKDSVDISNKENIQPTLNKKPSSFFRRRKKSISTAVVPPVPLTLGSSLAAPDSVPGDQSPVSSLKAFMDPYLTDDSAPKSSQTLTHPLRSASPLHSFYMPQESAGTGISRTESAESIRPRGKDLTKLVVPQKETFLTDTSSCEEGEHSATSDLDQQEPQAINRPSSQRPTPRAASTTPALSTIRPVIEARSSSWHSDRLGVPPRKDSLIVVETKRTTSPLPKGIVATHHLNTSGSDVSEYKSAPNTPAVPAPEDPISASPCLHVSHPSASEGGPISAEIDKAQHVYNNGEEDVEGQTAAAWLGEAGSERERIRKAYMTLFDWTGHNILAALRGLCSRLILKAESQLIDRILDAFAKRWCACNPSHGFKSADVVHTICYSLLLLNTDLHMADIGSKMTRNQFVKNAMQTIRPVVADASDTSNFAASHLLTVRSDSTVSGSDRTSLDDEPLRVGSSLGHRPTEQLIRAASSGIGSESVHGPLVDVAFSGSQAGWEGQIEAVLKDFYYSIQREPLPLFGSDVRYVSSNGNNNLLSLGGLRRTPSVLSKAQSESNRSRFGDSKSLGSKWTSKGRSRPRIGSTPGFGSSKNSLDDQSSAWSPSMSSTWSKASLGKTLTSMSVDSFATGSGAGNDYNASIGFANALSQAIIREDQMETQTDDGSMKAAHLLEDESLELEGAPWAKEGILKHKCHLEGMDRKSKDRTWNDCFAVIEKGWMRLFSFSVTAKSMRSRARTQKPGGVVGGGNWQDNAEEVWKFMLRHTIASSLPPPGYSKARPHVWALSLPTGAVHLFSAGTPDIVKEFVSTANFWSARLSKEPMIGGVSSMEYGWSDNVINRALIGSEVRGSFTSSEAGMPRPSTQMSIRSSVDYNNPSRPRLAGDKMYISIWSPPQQSLMASQLMEVDQLRALQTYVQNIEEELQKHNELRGPMLLAFSSRHGNYGKAMSNWEKKSAYLLREIVKFKNYIDALQGAQVSKERVLRIRRDLVEQRQDLDDSNAFYGSATMVS